jgi:hypothetical protein
MPHNVTRSLSGLALALVGATASAQVTVSGPSNGPNCFPFSCKSEDPTYTGTRYQQVYASAAFAGPLSITDLTFFREIDGVLSTGSFDIYLSTTSAPVDGLNPTDLDANLGATTSLFGSYTIGGAAPPELTFVGTPYSYDPTAGNLLVDFRVTSMVFAPRLSAAYWVGRAGPSGGNYSRAHDFGTQTAGWGLDTRFGGVTAVPEPGALALLGGGLLVLGLIARRLRVD